MLRFAPKLRPVLSSREWIFAAGVAMGPKDIPDAIVEAGAAAMEAANYLERVRYRELYEQPVEAE